MVDGICVFKIFFFVFLETAERCHNGGECVEGHGLEFTCQCTPGWEGQLCDTEINECASSPCLNGGVCVDKIAEYACACPMGFTGTNCEEEVLKCDSSPCQNQALCLMEEGIPVCYCVPDYHGERCELQYDECQLGPRCMNGGVCIDGIDDFTCSCPPQLTGRLCECLIIDTDDLDCNYTAPTTIATYVSTAGAEDFTTESETTFTVPISTATAASGKPKPTTQSAESDFRTTTRSHLSTTSFQTPVHTDTQTFRPHTGDNELHPGTFPYSDSTPVSTDGSFIESTSPGDNSETTPYITRFSTRPTPGQFTTYEPTLPVPTDAPEHITHFFTEFPRYTTSTTELVDTTTLAYTTTTVEGSVPETIIPTTTAKVSYTTTGVASHDHTTIVEPHPFEHTTTEAISLTSTIIPSTTTHSIGIITSTEPHRLTTTSASLHPTRPTTNATIDCVRHPCNNGGTCSSTTTSETTPRVSRINFP